MTKSKTKLRLVEAPHKRAMLEREMRYDLMIGDELVGEAHFNMRGYGVVRQPGKLEGFMTGVEHSLTSLKREVRDWNEAQTLAKKLEPILAVGE